MQGVLTGGEAKPLIWQSLQPPQPQRHVLRLLLGAPPNPCFSIDRKAPRSSVLLIQLAQLQMDSPLFELLLNNTTSGHSQSYKLWGTEQVQAYDLLARVPLVDCDQAKPRHPDQAQRRFCASPYFTANRRTPINELMSILIIDLGEHVLQVINLCGRFEYQGSFDSFQFHSII